MRTNPTVTVGEASSNDTATARVRWKRLPRSEPETPRGKKRHTYRADPRRMTARLTAAVVTAWLLPLALSMCSDTRHECGQWAKDSHCADNPECALQLRCSNLACTFLSCTLMRSSWQS